MDGGDDPVVRCAGLTRRFGERVAVNGISFTVPAGTAFGVLGPNGAGKTTTMRMVAAMSPRTSGDLRVFGLDPAVAGPRIRSRLGIVPQQDRLDPQLSCQENVYSYARYFGLPRRTARERTETLLAFMGLDDRADAVVEQLSGGMKRRLSLARALVNAPALLLLDEPTTGLDPEVRQALWDQLLELKHDGISLVLTTHDMTEAAQLCDNLVIMCEGRIVAEGTPTDLVGRYASREVVELRLPDQPAPDTLRMLETLAKRVEVNGRRCTLYADAGDAVLQRVVAAGLTPSSARVRPGNLEDVYLRLAGGSLTESR